MKSTVTCRSFDVLVIIENASNRRLVVEQLQRRGCRCQIIGSVLELEDWLAQQDLLNPQLDAVVIDLLFAGVAAQTILARGGQRLQGLPTVLATNGGVEELTLAIRALRTFACDILIDSSDQADMDATFAAVLGSCADFPRQPLISRLREMSPVAASPEDCSPAEFGPVQQNERRLIVEALERTGGHVCEAAKILRLGQATVYRKIQRYRISRTSSRPIPAT